MKILKIAVIIIIISLLGCDTLDKSIFSKNSDSGRKNTIHSYSNRLEIVLDTLEIFNYEICIPVTRMAKKRRQFFYDIENHSYHYIFDGPTLLGVESTILSRNTLHDIKCDSLIWEKDDSLFYSKKFKFNDLYYRIDSFKNDEIEKYYQWATEQNVQQMDSIMDNITFKLIESQECDSMRNKSI